MSKYQPLATYPAVERKSHAIAFLHERYTHSTSGETRYQHPRIVYTGYMSKCQPLATYPAVESKPGPLRYYTNATFSHRLERGAKTPCRLYRVQCQKSPPLPSPSPTKTVHSCITSVTLITDLQDARSEELY